MLLFLVVHVHTFVPHPSCMAGVRGNEEMKTFHGAVAMKRKNQELVDQRKGLKGRFEQQQRP